ncbi:hypothetical protein [Staphylococcus felis]|uniref:hypothetical protein n=1 Tax=Staphylococcus felis TaxID=46127 RepID=UPI003967A871
MKRKLLLSIFSFVVLFSFNSDFSKGDLNLFKNNQERVIVHNPLNNTADARGRIKVGREKKNKSRSKSNYSSRKDSRAKTNKKHTPSKKHKGGKITKGSNKKKK